MDDALLKAIGVALGYPLYRFVIKPMAAFIERWISGIRSRQ